MYERPTRLEMRSAIIGAITSRTRWTLRYPCFCYWKVSLNLVNKPGSLFDLIRCQLQPLFEEGASISFHNPFSIFVTLVWPQNFSRKKMWELQELRIFFIRKVVSWKFLFSLHYNFVYYHLFKKKCSVFSSNIIFYLFYKWYYSVSVCKPRNFTKLYVLKSLEYWYPWFFLLSKFIWMNTLDLVRLSY